MTEKERMKENELKILKMIEGKKTEKQLKEK